MSIPEVGAKTKRINRSIVLHLANTIEAYQTRFIQAEGIVEIVRRVEIADSINWGRLADGHDPECPRRLHFTHHDTYVRMLKQHNGNKSSVTIHRVRCLECQTVFTVLPSFVVRYKRYDTDAIEKFMIMLYAPTQQAYVQALNALPEAFNQEPLASRKQSLQTKQALFQAWITDHHLALVTTALDQCMKFLNRKQENMQTLRGDKSGLVTMNAWATTRNCWRFLKGAKRAGLAPIELTGANLAGIPWMQWVNLVLHTWPTIALAAGHLAPST